jgi:ATP-dependent helicase HrpB
MPQLPIESALPDLLRTILKNPAVLLSAPPGAGKTTRVPLALAGEEWLRGRKLILLEPRRLAARRAAEYMSSQLRESVGQTVGYRIRGDSRISAATRIEVVTEGILTRIIQEDPSLPNVGCIVFDEFHERSIHADLGLALSLDVQEHLREDLRILIMSATLDGVRLSAILHDAPLVQSAGRAFPVVTKYLPEPVSGQIEKAVAGTILRALDAHEGDILAFLPGQREIRRVSSLLEERSLPETIHVHHLFGEAGYRHQQAAITPVAAPDRKVILSTSIAETSLTIDGVRVVVDSGLARSARFDPRRGMTGLVTLPVSRAAADQRQGRAGRQAPGVCFRLWTEPQHAGLQSYPQPEILTTDLAPLALELSRWGSPDGGSLRFIDRPPSAHLEQARALLISLGAVDNAGKITPHGKALASLPTHPRLAHMMIRAKELGHGGMACDVAALLEERDILTTRTKDEVDFSSRWHAFHTGSGADRTTRERVRAQSRRFREALRARDQVEDEGFLGIFLALAYPERIGKQREGTPDRLQLSGGTGAVLPPGSLLSREKFLAIAEVDGIGNEVRVFLAAPVRENELMSVFGDQIREEDEVFWSAEKESVVARKVQRLGALVISEGSERADGEKANRAMVEGIRQMGLDVLPWSRESSGIRVRSEWLRVRGIAPAGWPDTSAEGLTHALEAWLAPSLRGILQRTQLKNLDLVAALRRLFTSGQWADLDRLAPSHIGLPSGSRIALQYESQETPVLAVKLQELFGQTETPRIGGMRIPVVIHLLSPAGRPVSVTQDLKSFWRSTYPEIRTQLRARYPKHYWPEDPLQAKPTSRTVRSKKTNSHSQKRRGNEGGK